MGEVDTAGEVQVGVKVKRRHLPSASQPSDSDEWTEATTDIHVEQFTECWSKCPNFSTHF